MTPSSALRFGVALRCSEPIQPPRLGKVYRPALAVAVHDAETVLRIGVPCAAASPSSRLASAKSTGPPRPRGACRRDCTAHWRGPALQRAHTAASPRQSLLPTLAVVVHVAERALRLGVALFCSKAEPASPGLVVLARVGHGVPDERAAGAPWNGVAPASGARPARRTASA